VVDIQALEYRRTLRPELDFGSTWDQEGEATGQSGGAMAGEADGLGAQGRGALADRAGA
jgi:hypothetical protein